MQKHKIATRKYKAPCGQILIEAVISSVLMFMILLALGKLIEVTKNRKADSHFNQAAKDVEHKRQ